MSRSAVRWVISKIMQQQTGHDHRLTAQEVELEVGVEQQSKASRSTGLNPAVGALQGTASGSSSDTSSVVPRGVERAFSVIGLREHCSHLQKRTCLPIDGQSACRGSAPSFSECVSLTGVDSVASWSSSSR